MLLEDEWGTINLIVPPPVYERHRLSSRTEPFVLAPAASSAARASSTCCRRELRALERPDLPRAEVKHIEPPAGARPAATERAGKLAAAGNAGDLRAVLPQPTASAAGVEKRVGRHNRGAATLPTVDCRLPTTESPPASSPYSPAPACSGRCSCRWPGIGQRDALADRPLAVGVRVQGLLRVALAAAGVQPAHPLVVDGDGRAGHEARVAVTDLVPVERVAARRGTGRPSPPRRLACCSRSSAWPCSWPSRRRTL